MKNGGSIAKPVNSGSKTRSENRSLIEAALDPLFIVSKEGKIIDFNKAALDITQNSEEELVDANFYGYFEEGQQIPELLARVFSNGVVGGIPLKFVVSGKERDVLLNGSIYDDDKNATSALIVLRDITAQKKFEDELIQAKRNAERKTQVAEEAMRAKQQFLSNMSHEIRTPLNAIIGFTNVVLKTPLDEKQKEYLNAIRISGDALIVLINDILDLAKVDAGKMTFESIPFSLSESVSSMLLLFETKLFKNKIELIREYDNSIPGVLIGDPVRLHQIILNLVGNAVKFTNKGRITMRVHKINEDENTVTIEFSVTDTGIGIAESELDNIFEYFEQASGKTARLYGGTGLGLAIVKQLVTTQGGTLSVKSKLGEGSTFSFTLNFKKTSQSLEKKPEPVIQPEKSKNKLKVLVAEDITLNQLLIKTLLHEFGFSQDTVSNGKLAVEKLRNNRYDIILMDLQMPEMNGYEATEFIRNNMNLDTPIIALTADVTTADVEKCKAVGMNDYVAKPIDEKLLYSKIVKLVDKAINPDIDADDKMEEVDSPKQKFISLDYLKRHTKESPEMMKAIIRTYIVDTPRLIKSMKDSINNMDWESLGKAAHAIIPTFSIMGISKEYEEMAKKIKDHAAAREGSADINTLLSGIEDICIQAIRELENELENL